MTPIAHSIPKSYKSFSALPGFFTHFHFKKTKGKDHSSYYCIQTSRVCSLLPGSFTDLYANKGKINTITTGIACHVWAFGAFMQPCYRDWSGTSNGPA